MKRITHFKGYDSYLEYDSESQTFLSKPCVNMQQQPILEPASFIAPKTETPKRETKRPAQKTPTRTKTLTGQQAALLV